MMTFERLRELMKDCPTVMSLDQELMFMKCLMSIPVPDIVSNKDDFLALLEDLNIAHSDSGIFQITPLNIVYFHSFGRWLEKLLIVLDYDEAIKNTADFYLMPYGELQRQLADFK